MSYTPTNWIDEETPVNAENLNKLEQAVQENSQAVDDLRGAMENYAPSWNDLTGKPFYEESGEVEIFPEQTVEGFAFEEGSGYIMGASGLFVLEAGIQYRVVWNGTEHYCAAYETDAPGVVAIFIGNEAVVTGAGSEIVEPFAISYIPSYGYNSITVMDGSTATTYDIAIYRDESVVKTLDAKFLPMDAIDARIEEYISSALEGDY